MPKYDPNKQYSWEEETDFILSGNEFGLILNTFRGILRTPEAQQILMLNAANQVAENVIKRSVESGLIKEVKTSPDPPMQSVKKEKPKDPTKNK